MAPSVRSHLNRFKADLPLLETHTIVQKHITSGECFILDHDAHFALRTAIANQWSVHISEVILVGSCKLGFSIAPSKRYRAFGDSSDIDVAVTSTALFERVWKEVFDYDRAGGDWPGKDKFAKYLFRGWVRPDLLPPSSLFETGDEWWEFFRALTASGTYGPYRIRGALYHSWWFLERYQEIAVNECKKAANKETST
jgi:hypothetical protein